MTEEEKAAAEAKAKVEADTKAKLEAEEQARLDAQIASPDKKAFEKITRKLKEQRDTAKDLAAKYAASQVKIAELEKKKTNDNPELVTILNRVETIENRERASVGNQQVASLLKEGYSQKEITDFLQSNPNLQKNPEMIVNQFNMQPEVQKKIIEAGIKAGIESFNQGTYVPTGGNSKSHFIPDKDNPDGFNQNQLDNLAKIKDLMKQ